MKLVQGDGSILYDTSLNMALMSTAVPRMGPGEWWGRNPRRKDGV